jgi:UDP-N-acetyl-D-glucosamine dehydrogenase
MSTVPTGVAPPLTLRTQPRRAYARRLQERIVQRTATVGVLGLGYVGLPVALAFAREGLRVTGIDLDADKVRTLAQGRSPLLDVANEEIEDQVAAGRFTPTLDYDVVRDLDAVILCLPTPCHRNKEPDLSYLLAGAEQIAEFLQPGQLIVLESTTYPGTTEEVLAPVLERSGLTAGEEFFLAFSPERIDPGNTRFRIGNTPRLVGGITPESTELARLLYSQVTDEVVTVSSPKVAEMAKLIENTFRHVNIALANEMALLCDRMEIDVWQAIDAAATKPYGFMPFYPGPGVGGHCIPIDPCYLSWKAREFEAPARFIELANEISASMPDHVVGKVVDALNDEGKSVQGARILVLGVAYKRDIEDVRESPGLRIIDRLRGKGAEVWYHDPHVPHLGDDDSCPLDIDLLREIDCAVLVTDHRALDLDLVVQHCRLAVDTRNVLRGRAGPCRVLRI